MTQEEIKKLIRECSDSVGYIGNWGRVQWADNVYPQLGDDLYAGMDLEAFAKLVAEAEREACAKVFDELAEKATNARDLVYLSQTAAIIRSRLGDEK